MCTPWTITKLVKKDCASCFLACRFPPDDEPADDHRRCATTPHQLPIRNMAFDIHDHGDSGGNEIGWSKNMSPSRHRKWNQSTRRRLSHDPKHVKETITTTTTSTCSSSTSWPVRNQSSDEESSCRHLPHFADEDQDYIVFCFREDGEFDVVKNVKQEGHNSLDSTSSKNSSRAINRKLNYDQNTKTVQKYSNEERLTEKAYDINFYPINDGNYIIFDQKNEYEEGKNICLDTKATPSGSMGEVSVESSDSNQSARSTASFAFPVLGVEWSGSPVQMPKPEALDLRKHKARCIGFQFQCCRF